MARCRSWRPAGVIAVAFALSLPLVGAWMGRAQQPTALGDLAAARSARASAVTDEAGTAPSSAVRTEADLRAAWGDPLRRRIELAADILLRDCTTGDPIRESPFPLVLEGHGHAITQACFEKRLLRQDGTGYLDIRRVTLTRGGSDGPGAALTSRGEIMLREVVVRQNLAEEPGGGVFSMRRITARRSWLNGNLANDDGGALYARRGGVQVYDSILSNNLVDGSGGAIGSTGDILVVRSEVDGNTTDGDGGALYTDEDGDVVVIGSHIDGSAADGPGGAIFTLDGDVAVYDSTLIGNRADDRGGAISGEGDVLVVNSTLARNLAVAHAAGGIWSRGDLVLVNSTVVNNYAEGEGGGLLSAGAMTLLHSTIVANIAPVGGDLGSAGLFTSFASVIGPPITEGVTGDTIPTRRSCRVYAAQSRGFNFVNDDTCRLERPSDILGEDPLLKSLEDDPRGFVLVPERASPLRRMIPRKRCAARVSRLPQPVPGGHLLRGLISWKQVLGHDARGRPRGARGRCDIGAVESGGTPTGRWGVHPSLPAAPVGSWWPGPAGAGGPGPGLVPVVRREAERATRGLRTLRARLARLDRELTELSGQSLRFTEVRSCLTPVNVDRRGDTRHRWGFQYDERDGTGPDLRLALVRSPRRRPDWRLLDLDTSPRCLSEAPDPNGTGEDARTGATDATPDPSDWAPSRLARWLRSLERTAGSVERRTERFDRWQSCLTAVPVTEAGARWQRYGYRWGTAGGRVGYSAAIDLDTSEWDDPDYQLIGFRGADRPFGSGECGTDPGEAADRVEPDARHLRGPDREDTIDEVREGIAALEEDVEDLREPVEDIIHFDECMYTIGVADEGGYRYQSRRGRVSRARALSFAIRGPRVAQLQLLVFPGEEPPQVECNEDASGASTDE